MAEKIEVPTVALTQVIERLTERRIAVEKAVTTLGEAPSGLRDVFELCRGFERAFSNIVNESPAANKIKEAFFSEKGLAGNVAKLPLEKVFEIESVKKITKTADGYQPHLVSPERGLRLMATRALDQVEGPVIQCVSAVYSMLVSAAREAAASAGEHTEAATSGKVPLNVPEFKNFVMPAIIRALDEWRHEAEQMASMLVDMERSYITAGFFRYTMSRRYAASQQQAVLQAALTKGASGRKKGLAGMLGGGGDAQADQPPVPGAPVPAGRTPSAGAPGAMNLSSLADPADYLAGPLDKKVNEDSARGSLPVQSWRWQRRFFIVSDSQKALFYFKSPDDVPKPNGLRARIDMTACVVEDLDENGYARPSVGSAMVEMQRGDRASLLLRVRSIDPRRPCVKDHNNIVLRAENVHSKYEWIQRLQKAASGVPGAQQQQSQPQSADPSRRTSKADADPSLATVSANSSEADPGIGLAPVAGPPPPGALPDGAAGAPGAEGLERRNSLEGMTTTRLGQGSRFFRADDLRDDHGRLLPAPGIVLAPGAPPAGGKGAGARLQAMMSSGSGKAPTVQETWEGRYEQLMEQFAQDMCLYMRMVCDTIVTTVPKSVVHCLVRKAEKNLLNHLFGFVHKMSPEELKRMLQEDDSVVQRRAAVRGLYDKVKMAIDGVQYLQEKIKRKDVDGDTVAVNAEVVALAAMTELLTGDQRRRYSDFISSPHLPQMRPPVPLSHVDRPKKLPSAPQGLLDGGAGATAAAGPLRAAPPGPPGRASGGGAVANGVPQTPTARRAPPPPPK